MPSSPKGFAAVDQLAKGSLNTPETCQTSMDANRMVPPRKPMGPSGRADIETEDVQEGMPVYTEGTKVTQASRKKYLSMHKEGGLY